MPRIVFEGVRSPFKVTVERWLGETFQIENPDIADFGRMCALTVDEEHLAEQISDLLRQGNGPEGLYCAVVPSGPNGEFPETIAGPAYETERARVEESPGRHILLSALPPKISRE